MATTVSLPLTAARYMGTGLSPSAGDYVGNIYAGGYPEYYRVCLVFTPERALSGVNLMLRYYHHNQEGNVSFRCAVAETCPAPASMEGEMLAWVGQSAAVTLTQRFEAGKSYCIWVWSPSAGLGYVELASYSAEGTIAAPALYVKSGGGWRMCAALQVKTEEGWTESEGLHGRGDVGWKES